MLSKKPCRQLLSHKSSYLDRFNDFFTVVYAFLDRKFAYSFSFQTALHRINTRNASSAFLVLKNSPQPNMGFPSMHCYKRLWPFNNKYLSLAFSFMAVLFKGKVCRHIYTFTFVWHIPYCISYTTV